MSKTFISDVPDTEQTKVEKQWLFDGDFTQRYTKVRQNFIEEFLTNARRQHISLTSAADVGCGVGYFSDFLSNLDFKVIAVDGREENTAEGRRRYPQITFLTRNVEEPSLADIGVFDFVLCVGLLYHLENPFRAVRNLYPLTGKVLIVEGMCAPGDDPNLHLLDEYESEDQGLNYVAFYPTEPCLVKMLYRAGFPFVYRFKRLPADKQFQTTLWRKKSRAFLVASKIELNVSNLVLADEPFRPHVGKEDPWSTKLSRFRDNWAPSREIWARKMFNLRVIAARLLGRRNEKANSSSSGNNSDLK